MFARLCFSSRWRSTAVLLSRPLRPLVKARAEAEAAAAVARRRQAPQVPSVSKRPNGGGLATIRMGAPDNNMWFGWRVAMPTAALKGMTLLRRAREGRRDPIRFRRSLEHADHQLRSAEAARSAPPDERARRRRLPSPRDRRIDRRRIASTTSAPTAATRRRVFEFAKAINVPLIITSADAANLAELDTLAEEFEINVALESKGDPKIVMAALDGRGKRLGVSAHLGGWVQAGVKAGRRPRDREGQAAARDRLRSQRARARGAVSLPLGDGAAGLGDFFLAVYRAGIKPLSITVESTGATEADMMKNVDRVRARHVAGDGGPRQRHAEDAGRPDSRR